MLYLITGSNGAGKSLRAIQRMYKYHGDGVQVFAHGFRGLKVPFAVPFDDPRKWRDLPPNSVLFIDEAQNVWRSRSAAQKIPPEVIDLETHRHQGIDLVLVTQSPMYIDSHLRSLISGHEHLIAWGQNAARVFKFAECFEDVKSLGTRSRGEYEEWKHPTQHYADYESAEVHTKKPPKPWRHYLSRVVFGLAALLAVWAGWKVYTSYANPEKVPTKKAQVAPAGQTSAFGFGAGAVRKTFANAFEYEQHHKARTLERPWSAPAYDDRAVMAEPELYCMASGEPDDRTCHCQTEQGTRYGVPMPKCEMLARWGPAYNPYKAPVKPREGTGPGISGVDGANGEFRIMGGSESRSSLIAAPTETAAVQTPAVTSPPRPPAEAP